MYLFTRIPPSVASSFRNYLGRPMSRSACEFLVNGKEYGFLKQLGLSETNFGVFDGQWKGSGQVTNINFLFRNAIILIPFH